MPKVCKNESVVCFITLVVTWNPSQISQDDRMTEMLSRGTCAIWTYSKLALQNKNKAEMKAPYVLVTMATMSHFSSISDTNWLCFGDRLNSAKIPLRDMIFDLPLVSRACIAVPFGWGSLRYSTDWSTSRPFFQDVSIPYCFYYVLIYP